MSDLTASADAALAAVVEGSVDGSPGIPGVAAVVTDRDGVIYAGAAGVRALGTDVAMTTDTVCAIFSTTKAVTATAVLQLVEDGRLDLDAPASRYVPEIGGLQVLDGFDDAGTPRLRAPRRPVTTRMLLLHTAGFGYDFFNAHYDRLAREHGQPPVISASKASLMTPLLHDPGDAWEYGSGVDWAGQVVEAITGQRLGDVLAERVFGPLGMTDTAFTITPSMRPRLAGMHQRRAGGVVTAVRGFELPQEPEVHMGGHGLYSTVEDYATFLRMWLCDGDSPDGRILRADTVHMAARNHLGDLKVRPLPGVQPKLTNPVEFFPGMPKSWALSFMVNDVPAPTGRPAGSLAWAGLANLYYWIDRSTGVAGIWATQLFPFADPSALAGYLDFETAVYRHRPAAA